MTFTYTYPDLQQRIDQVRRFERFYEFHLRKTQQATRMEDFTSADTRVLHEMGLAGSGCTGAWLSYRLDLDPAHVCRTLKKLKAYTLVAWGRSVLDGRMREWELTPLGRRFAEDIEKQYRRKVEEDLEFVPALEQRRLIQAMRVIEGILARRG